MLKFLTIGYGDNDGYSQTPAAVRATAHAQDARLVAEGAIMGLAGSPVQVRNPEDSGVETTEGPFLSSDLPIAGFAIIDAESLEEAIKKMSGVPCSVAHGVVEIWPIC
ncbi:YciI family protein [Gymnodinialimonas sp. 2305UL16-5]|uniref:YciI family protein n=1 Tax=Gymnodinialimonas mytili TaxID=3126503 RepID=UPI0030B143C6